MKLLLFLILSLFITPNQVPGPITLSGYWNDTHDGFVINNPTGACLWMNSGSQLPDSCGKTIYILPKNKEEIDQRYWAIPGRYIVITGQNSQTVKEALLITPDYYIYTMLPFVVAP